MKLGYKKSDGIYANPERKVLFVGDYIDRGPKIKETLEIVKAMVDSENAIALMGNHEYNAICFHMQKTNGGHLREHSIKNILQHYETLKQFQKRQTAYDDYIEWFKTLPLYFETENFRAVHACWDNKSIDYLKQNLVKGKLTDELIHQSVNKEITLHKAIDITLKGKEMKLPDGLHFKDKDGNNRTEMRIKWWENPSEVTYNSISIEKRDVIPNTPIDVSQLKSKVYYQPKDKNVFFGHYWLKGNPSLYKNNICCLDYSIAEEGKLVAYRYYGEETLTADNFVYV